MIDKVKVARSFSRSATTYNEVAWFQQDIGTQLLAMLPAIDSQYAGMPCVDLGCGTAYFYRLLQQQYPQLSYMGIDIAEGMLRFVKQEQGLERLLCADAEHLPLANDSVKLIFSNMALQWCNQLPQLFSELNRVLADGGVLGLSTLGPKTLFELKHAWAQVDDWVHVNEFAPVEQWRQAIEMNGFVVESLTQTEPVLRYESVSELLRELKMLGAHNVNDGQPQALTGKKKLTALFRAYDDLKKENDYPASYDVSFWVLRKAAG